MSRFVLAVLAVVLIMAGALVAAGWAYSHERSASRRQAARAADAAELAVGLRLDAATTGVRDTAGLLEASTVGARGFQTFTEETLKGTGLGAVVWLPTVTRAERAGWERRTGLQIVEPAARTRSRAVSRLRPAGARARYWPAHYSITRGDGPALLRGLDVGVDPVRRATIATAIATDRVTATPPLPLFRSGHTGIVLYAPVDSPAGVVAGSIDTAVILGPIVRRLASDAGVAIALDGTDVTEGVTAGPRVTRTVERLGRRITVTAAVPRTNLAIPVLVLVGGLGVALLTAALFALLFRRDRRLAGDVAAATRDLRARDAERTALLASLEESEGRLRTLIDSMPAGVLAVGGDGRVLGANPPAQRMLGMSGDDLIGAGADGLHDLIVSRDGLPCSAEDDPLLRALRADEVVQDEVVGLRSAAGVRWISVCTARIALAEGPAVLMSFFDVTDREDGARLQRALNRVAMLVATEAEPGTVFDQVAAEVGEVAGVDTGVVVRFDADLTVAATVGAWTAEDVPRSTIRTRVDLDGDGPIARTARTGMAVHQGGGTPGVAPSMLFDCTVTEAVVVPVLVEGRVWGALVGGSLGREDLAEDAIRKVDLLSRLASLAVSAQDARARLARLASTDHLTGLWNRRSFEERVEAEVRRARRHGRRLSLAILDVDHFKLVNDTFGHAAGDEVLREVARRLGATVRGGEIVARVGGEEFAWILPEADGDEAVTAAERVRAAIAGRPFGEVGRLTISVGVCDLADATDAGDMYRLADIALYWAKAQGRDRVFRYSSATLELIAPGEAESRLERARTLSGTRALATAIDAKDPATLRHSERVAAMARRLALAAGWSESQAELLHEAGLVHDVGKIAVPDAILLKAGPLTLEEYGLVKQHAATGALMLEGILTPEQISWVRGHHERADGLGYPDGLAGDELSEGAALLALADAWDAMTGARVYAPPMTSAEARADVEANAGRQFTLAAVAALAALGDPPSPGAGRPTRPADRAPEAAPGTALGSLR